MGRLARRKLGSGIYHVFNRSANQAWILAEDQEKDKFIQIAEQIAQHCQMNIYHYVVMSNHFHFAIEADIKTISRFISGVCSSYSKYWHAIHQNGYGPIWQGRYKSVLVQREKYLLRLGRYIEQNPSQAGLIPLTSLAEYRWSSAPQYLKGISQGMVHVEKHPLWCPERQWTQEHCQRYAEYLNVSDQEATNLFQSQAACIGDDTFRFQQATIAGRSQIRPGRPRKE